MRIRLSHLCSERASLPSLIIEWPGIVSQNGLLSAKTSACCFYPLPATLHNLWLSSEISSESDLWEFSGAPQMDIIQNVILFKLASVLFVFFPPQDPQMGTHR